MTPTAYSHCSCQQCQGALKKMAPSLIHTRTTWCTIKKGTRITNIRLEHVGGIGQNKENKNVPINRFVGVWVIVFVSPKPRKIHSKVKICFGAFIFMQKNMQNS